MDICNSSYYYTASQRAALLPANTKELAYLTNTKGDAAALIVQYGTQNVLAHRGTELTATSIAQNLDMFPAWPTGAPPGCYVNKGYFEQFNDIDPQVRATNLVIDLCIGHSMGGCIALLDGFVAPWYNNQPIIAFAPPKVVNGAFWLNKKINLKAHFSYYNDFAIDYPWKLLDNADDWTQSPYGYWWINKDFSLHWLYTKPPVVCDSFDNHVIGAYVSAFQELKMKYPLPIANNVNTF